jgi:NADH:ubiquinone oxidoreductase subunit K
MSAMVLPTNSSHHLYGNSFSVFDIFGHIQGGFIAVVLVIGLMGNFLSLVVFSRARRKNDPTVQYFTCVTIGDAGVLIFLALPEWLQHGMPYLTGHSLNLYGLSNFMCKSIRFCCYTCATLSSLCLVSFTLERAVFVWFPLKRAMLTGRNRTFALFIISVASILTNIHVAIFMENFDEAAGANCYYNKVIVDFSVDNLRYVTIPCFLIFFFNIIIIAGLIRAQKARKKVSTSTGSETKQHVVLVNLILISLFYIIFNIPRTVVWNLFEFSQSHGFDQSFDQSYLKMLFLTAKFCELVWLLNYCTNFVIYCVSLKFYTQELARLCRC